jgi:hypothetical protein
MGCAARLVGDVLIVAAYGEWDSRIEGARMKLVVLVPGPRRGVTLALKVTPGAALCSAGKPYHMTGRSISTTP